MRLVNFFFDQDTFPSLNEAFGPLTRRAPPAAEMSAVLGRTVRARGQVRVSRKRRRDWARKIERRCARPRQATEDVANMRRGVQLAQFQGAVVAIAAKVTIPDAFRSRHAVEFATALSDHSIRVFHRDDGLFKLSETPLNGHPRTVFALRYCDGADMLLASGCLAGQVLLWHTQSKSLLRRVDVSTGLGLGSSPRILSLEFSRNRSSPQSLPSVTLAQSRGVFRWNPCTGDIDPVGRAVARDSAADAVLMPSSSSSSKCTPNACAVLSVLCVPERGLIVTLLRPDNGEKNPPANAGATCVAFWPGGAFGPPADADNTHSPHKDAENKMPPPPSPLAATGSLKPQSFRTPSPNKFVARRPPTVSPDAAGAPRQPPPPRPHSRSHQDQSQQSSPFSHTPSPHLKSLNSPFVKPASGKARRPRNPTARPEPIWLQGVHGRRSRPLHVDWTANPTHAAALCVSSDARMLAYPAGRDSVRLVSLGGAVPGRVVADIPLHPDTRRASALTAMAFSQGGEHITVAYFISRNKLRRSALTALVAPGAASPTAVGVSGPVYETYDIESRTRIGICSGGRGGGVNAVARLEGAGYVLGTVDGRVVYRNVFMRTPRAFEAVDRQSGGD